MKTLLPTLLLAVTATAQADTLHLCPPERAPAGAVRASLPGPDGSVIVADSRAELPGCRALPLGADAARVETLYPLAPQDRPGRTILLYGPAGRTPFVPSSHELPQPAPQAGDGVRGPVPLRASLLPNLRVRPFGVEERVRVWQEDGRLRLQCSAGTRAAGVLLDGPWTLPLARLRLAANYTASAGFALQAADEASAARESAYALGDLTVSGAARRAVFDLPGALGRDSWRQFVIQCPQQEATLVLNTLALEPRPMAGVQAPRSTWIWQRAAWIDEGDSLLAWAVRERIKELFITVPLEGARVADPGRLAAFVRRASSAGIQVTAVEGDPHMVLPDHRAATAERARALAAYNRAASPAERLRAMQFDVEPYLLPDTLLAPEDEDRHYLAMARELHAAAAGMPLEFVVPFWWSDKTGLLEGLAGASDALAVMDYRTDPEQILRFAVPFLDWATKHGKRVRIALEAGDVGAEVQRRYVRADPGEAGELLLADTGSVKVVTLLRAPVRQAGVPVYRFSGERLLDGSATSFYGNRAALLALLPGLEHDLRAWTGFGGIALHGWRN